MHTKIEGHTHTPSVAPAHVDLPQSLAPCGQIQIPHRLGKRTARTGWDGGGSHDSQQTPLASVPTGLPFS